MKILHIGQTIGGLDVYIRNSIQFLPKDFEFTIINGKDDKSLPFIKEGKVIVEHRIHMFRNLNILYDLLSIIQAIFIVLKEKPDVIHCHSSKGGVVGRISGFVTNTRVLYTPHAFSFLSTQNKILKSIYIIIEKLTKLNAKLLACSISELEIGMNIIGYRKSNSLLWINSVPENNNFNKLPLENYVCTIGRPCYQKNSIFLIDIISQVVSLRSDFKLKIIGVGHYSPYLFKVQQKIKSNHLNENIELISWVDPKEVLSYVANSAFYLTMSRYEGMPLAVLEAMSLSKSILASDVPGNRDCIIDGESGFIVPLENSALILEKLVKLWDEKQLRDKMGQAAKKRFNSNFNLHNNIHKLSEIYMYCRS